MVEVSFLATGCRLSPTRCADLCTVQAADADLHAERRAARSAIGPLCSSAVNLA
jgi:hypothetical protein